MSVGCLQGTVARYVKENVKHRQCCKYIYKDSRGGYVICMHGAVLGRHGEA